MKSLRTMWSSTDFGASELTRYASAVMCREARQGIFVLGILTMLLMAGLALLYHALGLAKTTSNSRGSGSGWIFPWLEPAACWFLHLSLKLRQRADVRRL